MATDVTMPRLSDSMEEGTIIKWLVSEGDEVKRGQEIAEIETDKANMTYEADTDGVLIEVVAGEGDTLAIGEVIARIGEEGEEPSGGSGKEEADSEEADEGGGEAESGDDGGEAESGSGSGGEDESGNGADGGKVEEAVEKAEAA